MLSPLWEYKHERIGDMEFILRRTSIYNDDKPHEKAYLIGQTKTQTVLNDVVTDEKIQKRVWGIKFDTIEELSAFQKECDVELALYENTLEICDTCRD